jgi:hypothetical protein
MAGAALTETAPEATVVPRTDNRGHDSYCSPGVSPLKLELLRRSLGNVLRGRLREWALRG